MSLNLRWVGEESLEQLALTRLRCYGKSLDELPKMRDWAINDARAKAGDFLLAERDGETVGTTTSLSMTMWMRGAALPCQGVAWVGTIRTARRNSSGDGTSIGVATAVMNETLRKGRERGQVVSALMPFRASFYEHFGYGIVERRNQWFVPLSILPSGSAHGIRYLDPEKDLPALKLLRHRETQAGQCDIETSDASWANFLRSNSSGGFSYIDQPAGSDTARGWMNLTEEMSDGRRCLHVPFHAYDSLDALVRQLHFLGGMKDQFHAVSLVLPTDVPLNHLLRETQVPHRPVEHPTSRMSMHTRMQVRILDHVRFFAEQYAPEWIRDEAVVAVRETEGTVSKFKLTVEAGRALARPTDASAQFECRDATWASIACGELKASIAVRAGLATCADKLKLEFLDAVNATTVAPYCREYF